MSSLKNNFTFFPSEISDSKSSTIELSDDSNLLAKLASTSPFTIHSLSMSILYSIVESVISCSKSEIAFRSHPPELLAI